MQPLVQLQVLRAEAPHEAMENAFAWIARALPSGRGLTVALGAWAPRPGATPAPWTLRALLASAGELVEAGAGSLPAKGEPALCAWSLGDERTCGRLATLAELPTPSPFAGARASVRLDGAQHEARVPLARIGSNLVLVLPLAQHRCGAGDRHLLGPVEHGLFQLARACDLTGPPQLLARLGARLCAELFATASVVIDATWWCALEGRARSLAAPVAVEHLLASPHLGAPGSARAIDLWLASLLGQSWPAHRSASARGVRAGGRRRAWPRASLPVPPGDAPDFAPLFAAARSTPSLPPGAFARAWQREWAEPRARR